MESATEEGATSGRNATLGGKYLTFCLGKEHYGLTLGSVREIIALMPVAPLPMAPECVRGVMNLRGRIIPVIDLRRRFGMTAVEDHDRKCIIVVDVLYGSATREMSLLVDAVSEVAQIAGSEIQDAPNCLSGTDTRVINGIARDKRGVVILLNVDTLFASLDIALNVDSKL